jgi:hypothetical protein
MASAPTSRKSSSPWIEADGVDADAREKALRCLVAVFPYAINTPTQWPLCRMLLPHVRMLEARFTSDDVVEDLPTLSNLAGAFLQGSGRARDTRRERQNH